MPLDIARQSSVTICVPSMRDEAVYVPADVPLMKNLTLSPRTMVTAICDQASFITVMFDAKTVSHPTDS